MSAAYREPVQLAVEPEDDELVFMRQVVDQSLTPVAPETVPVISLATFVILELIVALTLLAVTIATR